MYIYVYILYDFPIDAPPFLWDFPLHRLTPGGSSKHVFFESLMHCTAGDNLYVSIEMMDISNGKNIYNLDV